MANRKQKNGQTINPYRPRLVEEGMPINNFEVDTNSTRDATTQNNIQRDVGTKHHNYMVPMETPKKTPKIQSTSLQSLAKNPNRYKALKSRLVIGANDKYTTESLNRVEDSLLTNTTSQHNIGKESNRSNTTEESMFTPHKSMQSSNFHHVQLKLEDSPDDIDMMDIEYLQTASTENPQHLYSLNYGHPQTVINRNHIPSPTKNNDTIKENAHLLKFQHQEHLHGHLQQYPDTPYERTTRPTTSTNSLPIFKDVDGNDESEEMDIDHQPLPPLIVVDGANVAYAYADAMKSPLSSSKIEPDVIGIDIAVQYFIQRGLRVIVILPAQWMRKKPLQGDLLQDNAMMQTAQLDTLTKLKSKGFLCLCPPTDDDDAYIIDIARKADANENKNKIMNSSTISNTIHTNHSDDPTFLGGAYILSCDLFRDAISRDIHMNKKRTNYCNSFNQNIRNLGEWLKTRRISYTFYKSECSTNNGYEGMFIPNPKHHLIASLSN